MPTIADLNVLIKADVSDLEAGLKRADGRVEGFGSRVSGIAAGVGTALVALGALGLSALKSAGDIQALEKGFAATYKGSESLSVALAKVKELAKLPGLGLKEALQGATNLQAAGFSADLATRALGAFGNALATVGKGKADLDGVGLALGQIASKGKISAEEINQLAERVPQIRQAMQAAFGTSDTDLLQKAKISATDFVEGVTAELEKLPKVTGGINNAFENLQDAATVALSKLGTSLNKTFNIEGLIDVASNALNRLGDAFTALEPSFQAVASYFGPSGEGGQLFRQLAESVGNAATEIKGAFDALNGAEKSSGFIKDLIKDIVIGFTAAADVIGGVIGTITRALKGDFAGAEQQAQRALGALTAPIRNALGLTHELTGSFKDAFTQVDYFADELEKPVAPLTKIKTLAADTTKEMEKQLKALQALDKGYDNIASRTTKGLRPQDAPDFIELNQPGLPGLPTELTAPAVNTTALKTSLTDFQVFMAQFGVGLQQASEGMANSVGYALSGIAQNVGQALADGQSALEAFGSGILRAFGQIIVEYGEKLILLGIGNVAAQNYAVGAAQIAAGGVLVGGGAYVGSLGSSGGGRGGSLGGNGSSYNSPSGANNNQPTIKVVAEFKLRGEDLVAIGNLKQYRLTKTS